MSFRKKIREEKEAAVKQLDAAELIAVANNALQFDVINTPILRAYRKDSIFNPGDHAHPQTLTPATQGQCGRDGDNGASRIALVVSEALLHLVPRPVSGKDRFSDNLFVDSDPDDVSAVYGNITKFHNSIRNIQHESNELERSKSRDAYPAKKVATYLRNTGPHLRTSIKQLIIIKDRLQSLADAHEILSGTGDKRPTKEAYIIGPAEEALLQQCLKMTNALDVMLGQIGNHLEAMKKESKAVR